MGIGTSILGYKNQSVDTKVIKSINKGVNTTLNSLDEYILARKILKYDKFANKVRYYNRNSIIIIGNSIAGSIPETFLKNSSANIAIVGEGELSVAEVVKNILKDDNNWGAIPGIAFKNNDGSITINEKRKG